MVRRSLCGPIASWILAWTSSSVTWSLYEMHSKIYKLFTNFQDNVLANSKTKFSRLITYSALIHSMRCMYTLQFRCSVLSLYGYNLHRLLNGPSMKLSIWSGNNWVSVQQKKSKVHKLSKTSFDLLIRHRLSRP